MVTKTQDENSALLRVMKKCKQDPLFPDEKR